MAVPDDAAGAPEHPDAGQPGLDAMIRRERLRLARTRGADDPPADARGARVCCVLCLNRAAGESVEEEQHA